MIGTHTILYLHSNLHIYKGKDFPNVSKNNQRKKYFHPGCDLAGGIQTVYIFTLVGRGGKGSSNIESVKC